MDNQMLTPFEQNGEDQAQHTDSSRVLCRDLDELDEGVGLPYQLRLHI
jgi:hypothetical protein